MVKAFLTTFFYLGFYFSFCLAQESIFSGKITDSVTGNYISGAHVFIPNTSYQTYSDSTGTFILPSLPLGYWKLKAFASGFEMKELELKLTKSTEKMDISLDPKTSFAPIQKSISGKKLEKTVALFIATFLGIEDTKNSPQISLVNPEALIFEKKGKEIQVSTEQAVYFQNSETGYLVTTYFEPFILEKENLKPVADYVYFELDPNGKEDREAIRTKQLRLFENSVQYQMIRLLSGETEAFAPAPQPKVFYGDQPGEYKLTFTQPTSATLPNGQQVSFSYTGEELALKSNGAPVYPDQLKIDGEIEPHSPIFYLPSNFEGEKILRLKNLEKTAEGLQERIYVHTDRGYYWPNESILFKAYVRYGNVAFMDDLSKVLHVELLDESGYQILHRVFKIDNGLATGFFTQEKPLTKGNYILKAYTAWSTNYGDDGAFHQPIQILDWDDFPPQTVLEPESTGVSFFSNKQSYGPNEKVVLNILAQDEQGKPIISNLSVAVLDLNQTQPLREPQGFSEALALQKPSLDLESFANESEFGITLEGMVYDLDQRPIVSDVELLINGLEEKIELKTGQDGRFTLPDRQFEGEFEVAMKATSREGRTSKSLEIQSFGVDITLPRFDYPKPVIASNNFLSKEEIASGLGMDEILMEEAIIESTRESKVGPMPYGAPSNVIDPSQFRLNGDTQQFLYFLASKVPGMRVGGTPLSVSFRGGEPLVMINGIPAALAGTPVIDVLSRINVFTIERVEVVRGLVPTIGDQGRNGVISIITKTGAAYDEAIMANMNAFQSFKFEGFPSAEELKKQIEAVNMPGQIQRPVLYWNPNLVTKESNLSERIEFMTGKVAGPMWIEIRGISEFGEPIYGRFLINGN